MATKTPSPLGSSSNSEEGDLRSLLTAPSSRFHELAKEIARTSPMMWPQRPPSPLGSSRNSEESDSSSFM